jgi:hypothetical protein
MTPAAQPDHVALVVVAACFERLHVMRDLRRASCTAATDAIAGEHSSSQSRRAPAIGAQSTSLLAQMHATAPASMRKLVTATLGADAHERHEQSSPTHSARDQRRARRPGSALHWLSHDDLRRTVGAGAAT